MRLPMKDGEVDLGRDPRRWSITFLASRASTTSTPPTATFRARAKRRCKACLTSRYPRDQLHPDQQADRQFLQKLRRISVHFFAAASWNACGVDYFDFYLMHAQSATTYQHFKACRAYETAFALKAEGKVRACGHLLPRSGGGAGTDPDRIPADRSGADSVQLCRLRRPRPYRAANATRSAANTASPCSSWNRSRAATWSTCREEAMDGARRAPRRQPRQLCHPLCRRLSRA